MTFKEVLSYIAQSFKSQGSPWEEFLCPKCLSRSIIEVPSYTHWTGFTHPARFECRNCDWVEDV